MGVDAVSGAQLCETSKAGAACFEVVQTKTELGQPPSRLSVGLQLVICGLSGRRVNQPFFCCFFLAAHRAFCLMLIAFFSAAVHL